MPTAPLATNSPVRHFSTAHRRIGDRASTTRSRSAPAHLIAVDLGLAAVFRVGQEVSEVRAVPAA